MIHGCQRRKFDESCNFCFRRNLEIKYMEVKRLGLAVLSSGSQRYLEVYSRGSQFPNFYLTFSSAHKLHTEAYLGLQQIKLRTD